MKKQDEYQLQKQVCAYLNANYPEALYMSDTIASTRLTMPQAIRNKAIQKNGFKCPDLIILEPKRGCSGLFIELKVETPYKLNGELKKNEHLEGQRKTMEDLINKGYMACFSWSFEQTKEIIDRYFSKIEY